MVFTALTLGKVRQGGEDLFGNLFAILFIICTFTFYFGRWQPVIFIVTNVILFFVLGFHWWLLATLIYFVIGCFLAYFLSQAD
jgi:predicted permease